MSLNDVIPSDICEQCGLAGMDWQTIVKLAACLYIQNNADGGTVEVVEQVGHAFVLPTHGFIPVYTNAGVVTAAIADDPSHVHTAYIVGINGDNLTLFVGGMRRFDAHGLTVGQTYWLSDSVAGDITTTEPAISKVCAIPFSANIVALYNQVYTI